MPRVLERERTRPLANMFFWCDPVEQLIGIFMTQILPSDVYPLQVEIRELTYHAVRENDRRRLHESTN
jgi:hypothetical protein